jgi:hypothetical protein
LQRRAYARGVVLAHGGVSRFDEKIKEGRCGPPFLRR